MEIILLTNSQKKVFNIFDSLIDNDKDVWRSIQDDEALRRRVGRAFESVGGRTKNKSALFMYGFDDYKSTVTPLDYRRCWDVSNKGVHLNKDYLQMILSTYNKTEKELLIELIPYKYEAYDEFISLTVSSDVDFKVTYSYFRENYPDIFSYIQRKYARAEAFYKAHNIDPVLIHYNNSHNRNLLISLGLLFEILVREYVFPDEDYQVEYKNCRPDFIISGKWVDVKLSKGTSLSYGDKSISKYLNFVDNFEVIYAVEDGSDTSFYEDNGYVKFTPISDYFDRLNSSEIKLFEDFIENASKFKEAINCKNKF